MQKPVNEIDKVIEAIKTEENIMSHKFSTNTIYYLEDNESIVLLESGVVSFLREQDNKLLFELQGPFPVGLTKMVNLTSGFYLKCETEVQMSFMESERVADIIEEKKLWKSVLSVVCYMIHLNESYMNVGVNAYDIIRNSIYQIWDLPEIERLSTSIFDYIMKRHSISRSSISKIVRSLNDGGYIKTNRGTLLEVKTLPKKY